MHIDRQDQRAAPKEEEEKKKGNRKPLLGERKDSFMETQS